MRRCPKCNSPNWDYSSTGLPNAILCTDCGLVYNGSKQPDSLTLWPFPSKIIPFDGSKAKFNPNNHEDAPL